MITEILTDKQRQLIDELRTEGDWSGQHMARQMLSIFAEIEEQEARLKMFEGMLNNIEHFIEIEDYERAQKSIEYVRMQTTQAEKWDFQVERELTGLSSYIETILFFADNPMPLSMALTDFDDTWLGRIQELVAVGISVANRLAGTPDWMTELHNAIIAERETREENDNGTNN